MALGKGSAAKDKKAKGSKTKDNKPKAAAGRAKNVKKAGGKKLESAELFDVYKGEQMEKGKKSLAYSLVIRAQDRTMTDEETDAVVSKILKTLEAEFGAKLR